MNLCKLLLISSFYAFFASAVKAQELSFNHLTTANGLSSNTIMSMYQDERGYLWIGTRNGVNLYNGKEFKIYKYEKNEPNSLHYNDVTCVTGDKNGKVYFMTSKGVSAFDIQEERFTTLTLQNMSGMYYHKHLYISVNHSIYQYNGKKFILYYQLPDQKAIISHLYMQNDSILIGTDNKGLYILDENKKLTHPIQQSKVCDLFGDRSGRYWIPTWEQGVYMIENKNITNFRSQENAPSTLSSDFTHKCCEDKQGNIWIGTFNGLNRYNSDTRSFTRYTNCNKDKGLSHLSIWSLLCDQQGTLWIGSYFGGINYFNPDNLIFQEYSTALNGQQGLSSSIIGKMLEDKNHNLWICTDGGGLNKYNPQIKTFTWYKSNKNANSLSHNNVKAIYYDPNSDVLWIGTHFGGLNKLDLKTEHFTHYLSKEGDPESLPSNIVRDIIPYQNQLILATYNGICLFDPATGKSKQLLKDAHLPFQIHAASGLLIDHQGTLWIAGNEQSICSYNFSTQKLKKYKHNHAIENSISSNTVSSIFEDSQKRLWFCTSENGLDLYHPDTDSFENFDKRKHGLASNVIYNICELLPDKLLLTTDAGFSIFNYKNKNFENYNKDNGFPLTSISENALYKTSGGDIFIGGVDGLVSFQEKNIHTAPRSYKIHPYRLIVNGQEIGVGDESKILEQSLTNVGEITLKPHQSIFSIEYAITDYVSFHKDSIVYRLEGFSNTWTSTRGQATITYTNLGPGTYTLVVKANDNESLVPESRLIIHVLPPFYRTVWAYLVYIIGIIGLAYILARTYNNRIKLQESLKYEKQHAEDIEKLNQIKLRFFTNISHEFRTPLTLIVGQIEMLLQIRSFIPDVYNKILGIYKSSLQLRELITELLDFRKQEQGYMTVKVSEHNLVDFAYESYLLFQEYATQQHISLKFRKSDSNIPIWYDAKQMQKVMNNLIFNAIKHTKEGGKVSVAIWKAHREVVIAVSDNGVGIAPKDIDKIFNRFYQTEQMDSLSYIGTGIGLSLTKGIIELHHGTIEVESEPGKETTFIVRLKMGNEHFSPEQICKQKEECQVQKTNSQSLAEIEVLTLEEQVIIDPELFKSKETKILIIEDNVSLCDMLTKIFETYYHVITASNGREGWEKVQSESPHIVLSDVVMPEMSGTELCKLIKGTMETCHIPVVLLTARTAIEYNMEGLRLGADDYITKPFNINILISRCNNLVNNRIMLQERFSKLPQSTPQILATNPLDKELLDKAMKIIEEHMDDVDFNVDVLAREMMMARTKLFIKLKAIVGQTPADFIMTIRLKRAAILLKEHPELNISEISDRFGFSSPRQFSKSFKEMYQVVPLAYRKGETMDTISPNHTDE